MNMSPTSFVGPNGQVQTEDEFFAYTETSEAVAREAAHKAKDEAAAITFWATRLGVDLTEDGALEKIAAKRAEDAKHFADFDDRDN